MGKSSNGPDWTDCEAMMRGMGALHSGVVELTVSPLGTGFGPGVKVGLCMRFDVLPGSSLPREVRADSEYPCGQCGSLWGHVFTGLYTLDYKIGETYKNEKLWED